MVFVVLQKDENYEKSTENIIFDGVRFMDLDCGGRYEL